MKRVAFPFVIHAAMCLTPPDACVLCSYLLVKQKSAAVIGGRRGEWLLRPCYCPHDRRSSLSLSRFLFLSPMRVWCNLPHSCTLGRVICLTCCWSEVKPLNHPLPFFKTNQSCHCFPVYGNLKKEQRYSCLGLWSVGDLNTALFFKITACLLLVLNHILS